MIDVHKYYSKKKKQKAKPSEKPLSDKELEKPLSEKEFEELRGGVMKHPALALFADEKTRQKIIFGGIKCPAEYEKDIVQKIDVNNTDAGEVSDKSQLAYLLSKSVYIGKHLERLYEEKIEGKIAEWYKRAPCAFTSRLKPIQGIYKDVDGVLAEQLRNLREDFNARYEKLCAVAEQCDIDRAKWFGALPVKPIGDFKVAAKEFYETIYAIHTGARIALNKLTKQAKIRILKIIGAVVGFLAALLTIFHYLGWLEPIKEFIRSISLSK